MTSVFDELLRIRNLREDKARRTLSEASARATSCEQALAQVSQELTRFIASMPGLIDAEYQKLEEEAMRPNSNPNSNHKSNAESSGANSSGVAISGVAISGVALHRVQSFRTFELDLYAQRDALRVAKQERQQALKLAQEELISARTAYGQAQRGRMKIEELQSEERKRVLREEERSEEKQLEEFKPHSIFAHLQ